MSKILGRKVFAALLVTVFLVTVGCTKEDVGILQEENSSVTNIRVHRVSEQTARQRLKSLMSKLGNTSTRSATDETDIAEVYTLTIPITNDTTGGIGTINPQPDPSHTDLPDDTDILEYAYVFNFSEDGGFAIMSALEELPALIAFSDKGYLPDPSLPKDLNRPSNPGIDIFITCLTGYTIATLNYTAEDGTSFGGSNVYKGESDTTFYNQNGCPVEWHQDKPFNLYCPRYTDNGYVVDPFCKVGCAAVAVAQLMACHQFPTSYYNAKGARMNLNWNAMINADMTGTNALNPSYLSEEVQQIAHLMNDLGVSMGMEYGPGLSRADFDNSVDVLKKYSYSCGTVLQFNKEMVYQELKGGYPILMSGNNSEKKGHAWLVDELMEITTKLYTNPNLTNPHPLKYETNAYFHCNWGWGKEANNGYFLAEVYALGNGVDITTGATISRPEYKYNITMITNIRPNK